MSLNAIVLNKCPRCKKGRMFSGIFRMYEACGQCQLKFERQEGYYTMAIIIANFLYALVVAPTLLAMTTLDAPLWKIIVFLGGLSLLAIPLIFRYARTLWLHFDFMIHPE